MATGPLLPTPKPTVKILGYDAEFFVELQLDESTKIKIDLNDAFRHVLRENMMSTVVAFDLGRIAERCRDARTLSSYYGF